MKHCPGCGTFYEGYDKDFCDLDGLALQTVKEPEKAEDPFLGTVVDGRYLVQSVLGKGGMGAVYKARQTSVERDIALKVILGETDEELRRRFMLEAKMTSSLQSVHTVTIFDFGVFNEVLYLAMEYLEGQSLEDKLDQADQLDWKTAIEIVGAIAESLEEAHDKGIVHRDLKPANIYLAKMGSHTDFVKVLDFGVAKFVTDENSGLTGTGMIVGTPSYMSPEQARARTLDARSDIYALGIMLYEMLAGVPPFSGEATVDVLLKHVTEEPPPLFDEDLTTALPEGLRGLLMSMLEKDPDDRPQTANAVGEACKTLLRGEVLGEDYLDPVLDQTENIERAQKGSARDITGEESTLAGPALKTATSKASSQDTALAQSPFEVEHSGTDETQSLEGTPSKKGLWMGIAALVVGGVAVTAMSLSGGDKEASPTKASKSAVVTPVGVDGKLAADVPASAAAKATATQAASKVQVAPQKVTLATVPAGATVVMPNGLTGKTPLELQSGQSAMTVTLKLEGYLDKVHTIAAKSSGEIKVTLSVDEAARRAKAEAKAKAKSDAEAKVKSDAEAKAKANKRARKKRSAKPAQKPAAKPKAKKPKAKSSRPGLF
jgi:serine/threonine protein kinase